MKRASNIYEFEAIGTHWWLERLDGGEFDETIKTDLAAYTAEFDRRYSRFRDDSLVIQLARDGILNDPPHEMIQMLEFPDELSEVSEGAFSLLIGNSLTRLGYGKSLIDVRSDPASLQREATWDESTIWVPKGTVLDFGGFGKGWLIDEYAKILREHGVKQYIVNGGGDLYIEADEPVSFALEHPYDPKLKIGDIRIQKGALAASSTVKRTWKKGRKTLHHIIDPQTGKPTNTGIVATFVCAHTTLVADALATILIIRPDLEESLERHYNAETLLINRTNVRM